MFNEKIKLVVIKHDDTHYHAYIKGHSTKCADGNSSPDAVGTLLLEYPRDFGVSDVEIIDNKTNEHRKPPIGGLFGGMLPNTNLSSVL